MLRSLRQFLSVCVWVFGALFAASASAAILQVNGSGKLTGALDVDVGGTLYSVEFLDGTCEAVFGACDDAHFAFSDVGSATAAAQALLDQVFLGVYDPDPTLTQGCTAAIFCGAVIPYLTTAGTTFNAAVAFNGGIASDIAGSIVIFLAVSDLAPTDELVYARFSTPAVTPAPATLALLGFGLAGLGWSRRRK